MEDRKNNQIIKEMYHGEENRDASSKIRVHIPQKQSTRSA